MADGPRARKRNSRAVPFRADPEKRNEFFPWAVACGGLPKKSRSGSRRGRIAPRGTLWQSTTFGRSAIDPKPSKSPGTTSPRSPLRAALAGRSKTKRTTPAKPRAITGNIISATAKTVNNLILSFWASGVLLLFNSRGRPRRTRTRRALIVSAIPTRCWGPRRGNGPGIGSGAFPRPRSRDPFFPPPRPHHTTAVASRDNPRENIHDNLAAGYQGWFAQTRRPESAKHSPGGVGDVRRHSAAGARELRLQSRAPARFTSLPGTLSRPETDGSRARIAPHCLNRRKTRSETT